ncbi:MAG: DUF2330 domain-containing protein [Phycisphaerales bacterium]
MPRTNLPKWLAVAISLCVTVASFADGKAFPMVADPLADSASTTMPRQRAIIAWDGTEQRLAIDTAFTGEGTEFAWLVPLPSEPEILPATTGMFDTAAVLTSPRIDGRASHHLFALLIFFATLFVVIVVACRRSVACAVACCLAFVVLVMLLLPALGKARSAATASTTVQVIDQDVAGLYETAVLRAQDADELIEWLRNNGFGVQEGVRPVVQDYLDKGWCFAAAKLRVDSSSNDEHRAHPLEFRFAVDQPVYPMALTAVGNGDIELELFVFADGSASTQHLRSTISLKYVCQDEHWEHPAVAYRPDRPLSVVHPRLVDMVAGAGVLTRLHGVLNARQQRQDMAIDIGPIVEHDPRLSTPEVRLYDAANSGLAVALIGGVVVMAMGLRLTLPQRRIDLPMLRRFGLCAIGGASTGLLVLWTTPVYHGAVSSGRDAVDAGFAIQYLGWFAEELAAQGGVESEASLRASIEENVMDPEDFENLREGDSPLHYRIEKSETEASLWFIWHDAIGGEHRSEIPLRANDEPGSR